jgi:hypothetical protein
VNVVVGANLEIHTSYLGSGADLLVPVRLSLDRASLSHESRANRPQTAPAFTSIAICNAYSS